GTVDLPVAENDVGAGDRSSAAAVDERGPGECPWRGRSAGGCVDGSCHRNLPAVRCFHEEALGDAAVLVGAVADAIPVRPVHPAWLQLGQVNVVGFDEVRPPSAGAFREIVKAGTEAGGAAAHEQLGVKVAGQVLVAIPLADGG